SVRRPITARGMTVSSTYVCRGGTTRLCVTTKNASGRTRLTASTTPATASANRRTRYEVLRRARACCSKNVTATRSAERDARRRALLRPLSGLQGLRRHEREKRGDDIRGEAFAADVVLHDRVVVALARERDPIFRARELFLQSQHVFVGLQLRIRLDDGEQSPERAREPRLRLREAAHRLRTARRAG